jgi:hypothetical protein
MTDAECDGDELHAERRVAADSCGELHGRDGGVRDGERGEREAGDGERAGADGRGGGELHAGADGDDDGTINAASVTATVTVAPKTYDGR